MENVRTLEQQCTDATVGVITAVTAIAPMLAVFATLGVSAASGYIEYLYQKPALGTMAIGVSLMAAGVRIFFGMTGIAMIKLRHFIPGAFFMAVALALTFFMWYHSRMVAETINPEYTKQIETVFTVLLFGGYVGEIGMSVYMSTVGKAGKGFKAINLSWKINPEKAKQNGHPQPQEN